MASGKDHRNLRKGRGATVNPPCRFHTMRAEGVDDGWAESDPAPARLETRVTIDRSRTVLTRNRSPDVPFEQSINPYRGCEHGCVYCFARPTHAYLDLSPGLDFESRILAKPDAAQLLRKELARTGYQCKPIAIGTNTDPYQPLEREWGIMRCLLEVMGEFGQPVSIVTKSALIERDLDLLGELARQGLAEVSISVTTMDRNLSRTLEPRAAAPQRRLRTIQRLIDAGVPTGVLVAPIIPVLTDPELEAVIEACADHGAERAGYVLLRLPLEVRDLFEQWLQVHHPLKRAHVMSRVRDTRAGRDNDARFGTRMSGEGPYARLIQRRFELACRRCGINGAPVALNTSRFRVPQTQGPQMDLF